MSLNTSDVPRVYVAWDDLWPSIVEAIGGEPSVVGEDEWKRRLAYFSRMANSCPATFAHLRDIRPLKVHPAHVAGIRDALKTIDDWKDW